VPGGTQNDTNFNVILSGTKWSEGSRFFVMKDRFVQTTGFFVPGSTQNDIIYQCRGDRPVAPTSTGILWVIPRSLATRNPYVVTL